MKPLFIALLACLITGCRKERDPGPPKAVAVRQEGGLELRLMSFNIRYENNEDPGSRSWRQRVVTALHDALAALLERDGEVDADDTDSLADLDPAGSKVEDASHARGDERVGVGSVLRIVDHEDLPRTVDEGDGGGAVVLDDGVLRWVCGLEHRLEAPRARALERERHGHRARAWLEVDGEMHGDAALDPDIRHSVFPNSRLKDAANLVICPTLDSANITFNLLKTAADGLHVGPMLLGTALPAAKRIRVVFRP